MNELVDTTMDRFLSAWAPSDGDDPRERLCEYIVDPNPFCDRLFDEGGGD